MWAWASITRGGWSGGAARASAAPRPSQDPAATVPRKRRRSIGQCTSPTGVLPGWVGSLVADVAVRLDDEGAMPGLERLAREGGLVQLDSEPRLVGDPQVAVLEDERLADQVAGGPGRVGPVFKDEEVGRRGR